MKTISRYIMTLALLLTAVCGAWAQSSLDVVELEVPAEWATDESNMIAADLPGFNASTLAEAQAWTGAPQTGVAYLIYAFVGEEVKYVSFEKGKYSGDNSQPLPKKSFFGTSNVKFYYTTGSASAEPPIDVKWDAATKTGTFEMPASDVVLTPVYAEATILNNHDQIETSYASLKEAFANVKEGDIIKLDWDVTLQEQLTTPERNGDPIHFMLDFNGYTITDGSGMAGYNCIELRNGDVMFLTDESKDKNGGLKGMVAGLQGSRIVFVGGRYDFGEELAATNIKNMWVDHFALDLGWSIVLGKEFIDLNNGSADADGFFVCVDFKTFELAIDSKRFATFYSDMNIKLAEQTAEGVGLYTISSIDADHSTATVTPISGIIPAGTPMLVYNGTDQEQTAKLVVTLDNAQDAVAWAPQFKGTATDKTFDADDMAAADYYALSGGKAFAPVKGAGTLGANQCWLQFDKQEIPSARQFTLVFDSEATGVGSIENGKLTIDNWYDLNGRKLNGMPTKKGIYMNNGRKVVVK